MSFGNTGKKKPRGSKNKAEIHLIMNSIFGLGKVETEHRFHPTRQWRFDYAVPEMLLAVEYQGHGQMGKGKAGAHVGGHATPQGLANDCEKINQAQLLGWTVIKLTAFHFREADRKKYKLTSPYDILTQFCHDKA